MLGQRILAPAWMPPTGPDWVPPRVPSEHSASSLAHSLSAPRVPSRWHSAPTVASIPPSSHCPLRHSKRYSNSERGSGGMPHAGVPCRAQGEGATGTSTSFQEGGVRYRPATEDDLVPIQCMVMSEMMNPLSLEWRRFLVAEGEEPGTSGQRRVIGIGQMKPWGATELDAAILELRSIIVSPEFRGKGVGSSIVGKLLEGAKEGGDSQPIYLLTIGKQVPFYERWGFKEVTAREQLPSQLKGELAVGKVLARLTVGDRCLCMKLSA